MTDFRIYYLILLVSVASVLPILLVRMFTSKRKWYYLYLAVIISVVAVLLYIYLINDLVYVYNMSRIVSIFLVTLVGLLFLKEKLNFRQAFGILLGITALILISQKD